MDYQSAIDFVSQNKSNVNDTASDNEEVEKEDGVFNDNDNVEQEEIEEIKRFEGSIWSFPSGAHPHVISRGVMKLKQNSRFRMNRTARLTHQIFLFSFASCCKIIDHQSSIIISFLV